MTPPNEVGIKPNIRRRDAQAFETQTSQEIPSIKLGELATTPITTEGNPSFAIDLLLCKIKRDLGIDIEPLDPDRVLSERLATLDTESQTIADESQIVLYGRKINDYVSTYAPDAALSPKDLAILDLASLTADTGKAGPAHASAEQLKYIAQIYSIDDRTLPNSDQKILSASLENFCLAFFPDHATDMVASLEQMGIPKIHPATGRPLTMRVFYNLHASWTYSLLSRVNVPEPAMQAAVNHHMLEGYPTDVINTEDGTFKIGEHRRAVGPVDVLVILLDKYDARIRRGGATHEAAIQYLREVVNEVTIASFDNTPNPAFDILNRMPPRIRELFNEYITYMDNALGDITDSTLDLEGELETEVA